MQGTALALCLLLLFSVQLMAIKNTFADDGHFMKFFRFRCGRSCANEWCSPTLGCTRCKSTYCRYFMVRRTPLNVCLLHCPQGYRCAGFGNDRFCTKIRT